MTDVTETEPATNDEVEQIIDEAKEEFSTPASLIDRIKNRKMRSFKLDLGYDEVNSDKLIAVEAALGQLRVVLERAERNSSGVDELKKTIGSLKRQIAKAADETEKAQLEDELTLAKNEVEQRTALIKALEPMLAKAKEMEDAAAELRADVAKDSLSVELRAIPWAIAKGSARRARKTLGITEKGIPEAMEDAFTEEQLVELAYDQVVRWRDNRTEETGTKLDVEVIRAMRDFLPMSQSAKFFNAVNDLQFKNAISESAIAQADF